MGGKLGKRKAAAVLVLAAAVAGVGALQSAPAGKAAVAATNQPECELFPMPLADITRGVTGTVLSVTQGRVPETFNVEVLGILENGVAPGRDMIVVNVSGGIWDQTGTWAGASGSPVYLNNPRTGRTELAGAVAFGLAGGASTLAGLTPAVDMVELLDPGSVAGLSLTDRRIAVPQALANRMAAEAGVSLAQVETGFTRLKTPLAVSGLTARGFARLQQAINRQNLPFIPYAGSSASAEPSILQEEELSAGDSFAAALSLGDVTAAGIGTTTFVCFEQAVAFGHPFTFTGDTTIAARAADTLTIVEDPIFGSYKLANVAGNAGTVTQDRLAGIMADLGPGPDLIPVTSTVTDVDRLRSRDGRSDVALPDFLPFLAFEHLFLNIDTTIDRIGPGNSEVAYTIRGTREGGRTWTLSRSSHYVSEFDISFGSIDDILIALDLINSFDAEEIDITSVEVPKVDVGKAVEFYRLKRVLVWNGSSYVARNFVRARPGQLIRLRAELTARHLTGVQTVDLNLRVPATARRSGSIQVLGGGDLFGPEIPCFFDEFEECGEDPTQQSFDALLAALRNQPRGDALVARLRLGGNGATRAQASRRPDPGVVVRGSRFLGFELIR
jgi:hypothetical protein